MIFAKILLYWLQRIFNEIWGLEVDFDVLVIYPHNPKKQLKTLTLVVTAFIRRYIYLRRLLRYNKDSYIISMVLILISIVFGALNFIFLFWQCHGFLINIIPFFGWAIACWLGDGERFLIFPKNALLISGAVNSYRLVVSHYIISILVQREQTLIVTIAYF